MQLNAVFTQEILKVLYPDIKIIIQTRHQYMFNEAAMIWIYKPAGNYLLSYK